jgi:L-Ala-D/L-Glu epimerase
MMQIDRCEVTPVELTLRQPAFMASHHLSGGKLLEIHQVTAIFIRLETRDRRNAWGCAVAHPWLTGEKPEKGVKACRQAADLAPDLHPTNLEYSLAQLEPVTKNSPAARCAFDLAFYDLLGLVADMSLYRLLGGFRNRIQTSATVPIASLQESVEMAASLAQAGFRMLKIKGGLDPDLDVERIKAIKRKLPNFLIRLDADGAYTIREALAVAEALKNELEMFEQPTPPEDLEGLHQVTLNSSVPILADQSIAGPSTALTLAAGHIVDGLSVKPAACGGLHCARQVETIARAARLFTQISCLIEPALLISAGLALALSSPSVRYADLDGHLDLVNDPTIAGFRLVDGWLEATDIPGLGCSLSI